MSIEKLSNTEYVPTCDICGNTLDYYDDFYDAINGKKANGWKAKRENYGWIDICNECQVQKEKK